MKSIQCLTVVAVTLGLSSPASAQDDCPYWNTFQFTGAVASDVMRCLEAGADPNARDTNGFTPLHQAVYFDRPQAVMALLEAGADPGVQNIRGNTPLHYAAYAEYMGSVRALLDAGADPGTQNIRGRTPMDFADAEAIAAMLEPREGEADPGFLAPNR